MPPGYQNNGSSPVQPGFTGSISGTVTFGFSLTGGMSIGQMANLGVSFQPSIAVSMTSSISAPGPTVPPGYQATPELCCTWYRDNYLVDSYGSDGFDATVEQSVDNYRTLAANIGWTNPTLIP